MRNTQIRGMKASNLARQIVKVWGQSVHNICTSCVQLARFCTGLLVRLVSVVHKLVVSPPTYRLVIRQLVPRYFSLNPSVYRSVIPTIHTANKENDKSKILNSLFLYTGYIKSIQKELPV
jgi:hypothetical protein